MNSLLKSSVFFILTLLVGCNTEDIENPTPAPNDIKYNIKIIENAVIANNNTRNARPTKKSIEESDTFSNVLIISSY